MSVDYASGLSHYDDLGVCGVDEILDELHLVREKVNTLAEWIKDYSGSCICHVGAGLSTSAGIPDFRGKRGVWTKLQQAQQANMFGNDTKTKVEIKTEACAQNESVSSGTNDQMETKPFDSAKPTLSHMVLKALCQDGLVSHIVSQNVDGLFLKSGLDRSFISELHGNFYLDECTKCRYRFVRGTSSPTMRLTKSSNPCPRQHCKGSLRDTILDWESPIPYNELRVATKEAKKSKLHICIGTSMQLRPSKDLVCNKRHRSEKLVIINLQPIKLNEKADLIINYYADDVMKLLAEKLNLDIPEYHDHEDPTKNSSLIGQPWTKMAHKEPKLNIQ